MTPDTLTLTLVNGSAKPIPLEVHIPSLTLLSCLDLTPSINISNEHKALTLKSHLAAAAPIKRPYQREELTITPWGCSGLQSILLPLPHNLSAPGLTSTEISPIGALWTDLMDTHKDQVGDVFIGEEKCQLSGI